MSAIEAIAAWGPRDYVTLPYIPESWRFADIGPGRYPHRRADVLIDKYPETIAKLDDKRPQIISDLATGLSNIPDGAFDYVWCSHVLEHVVDLQNAVDALNRISKRGCIVVPSFFKDAVLLFQEREHFWHCLPSAEPDAARPNLREDGPIRFVEHNHGFVERLRDPLAQQASSFLYQTGSQHDCTAEQYMRAFWQKHEPDMDLVSHWTSGKPLKVVAIR